MTKRRTNCRICAALAAVLLLGAPLPARAAEPSPELQLRTEADSAWAWRRNWTLINVALMAGSFAVVPLVERESRPDWIVSGAGSGITALTTFVFPLRVESAADELGALAPAERSQRLPRLWHESAEDEHDRVTWPWHVANFGLSAAAGAIIAFGYHHYVSGAITTVAGTALGEVQILTQPTRLSLAYPPLRAERLAVVPQLVYLPATLATPARFLLTLRGSL